VTAPRRSSAMETLVMRMARREAPVVYVTPRRPGAGAFDAFVVGVCVGAAIVAAGVVCVLRFPVLP
jgi:predicted TIM-barrel enzyme